LDVIEHNIVFTLFGVLPIRDTVLFTWITMGIIILTVLILKLLNPNLLEYILEMVISIVDDAMDVDDLHPYIPVLGSLMIFTLFANLISIIPGMKSPTADINTTLGLALIVVLSVHIYGMIKKGVWQYCRNFSAPFLMFRWGLLVNFTGTPPSFCVYLVMFLSGI
jgi:F-type H+-transporting ATPase subunit a